MARRLRLIAAAAALIGLSGPLSAKDPAVPIEIRAVVVTAFEVGEDTGDTAGELQAWAEAMPQTLPFAAGARPLRYDPVRKILVLNTGIGTNRAAVAVMALGSDPRFDLRHSYWLIAAIAGVNPNTASVGSAAWIGDVVDTDYGYVIDSREIPAEWEIGIFPLDRSRPYAAPRGDTASNLFPLNHGLRNWAYRLTADVKIPDAPVLAELRKGYARYPAAQCPPAVLVGDEATGQGFWHGERLNTHAEKWVAYWTGRPNSFVMTAMEDSGVSRALQALDALGRADHDRLIVLRTGSNYSVQPEGRSAAQSLSAEAMELSALKPSVDAAFLLGSRVVYELAGNWTRYRDHVPAVELPAVPTLACSAPVK